MKIRTDFVTNSSSSGFVLIHVRLRNGVEYELNSEYDAGWGGSIWSPAEITKQHFKRQKQAKMY